MEVDRDNVRYSVLKEYIESALQEVDVVQENHLVPIITKVLLAAGQTRIESVKDPNNKDDLIKILKDPWEYFKKFNERPRALSEVEVDTLGAVHDAAVTIGGRLVRSLTTSSQSNEIMLTAARSRAEKFVHSLMNSSLVDIPDGDGMKVMKNVYNPETDLYKDVIVRTCTEPFWKSCLRVVDTPGMRYRVCAVGTPGTGKSSSIPLLIRMLLRDITNCTIVYLCRSPDRSSWYYEYVREGDTTHAAVYPEKKDVGSIRSFNSSSTYFIVDPGKTTDSCGPVDWFVPKTIIVAPPDECHWGGSEFTKEREIVAGEFKYYPIWTLGELEAANRVLGVDVNVCDSYRLFGGVPRHVFRPSRRNVALCAQQEAVRALTTDHARNIAFGRLSGVGTLDSKQPKSALIGLSSGIADQFSTYEIQVISSFVAETIYFKFIEDLWNEMLSAGTVGSWAIFEAFTRQMLTQKKTFTGRYCVGKTHKDYANQIKLQLGGCEEIRLVLDLSWAVNERENVLYHSASSRHELIDFLYRDGNEVHAFQVTVGKKHECKIHQLRKLWEEVGRRGRVLRLYYLMPAEVYTMFVTQPAEPLKDCTCGDVEIFHVMVPNPNRERKAFSCPASSPSG